MKELIDRLKQTEHGFKHIIEAGNKLLTDNSLHHFDIAVELLTGESYQERMLGTYLLGQLSVDNKKALTVLRNKAGNDKDWRVQEMLAKAFDHYCKTIGYKNSLPIIKNWLSDKNLNIKRAVVEGLRIWTNRPYFKENPTVAIKLISAHKSDDSEYLRKSVGNALRDIQKKYKDLVDMEVENWDLSDIKIAYTRRKLGK